MLFFNVCRSYISHCVSKCVLSFYLLSEYWLIDWRLRQHSSSTMSLALPVLMIAHLTVHTVRTCQFPLYLLTFTPGTCLSGHLPKGITVAVVCPFPLPNPNRNLTPNPKPANFRSICSRPPGHDGATGALTAGPRRSPWCHCGFPWRHCKRLWRHRTFARSYPDC